MAKFTPKDPKDVPEAQTPGPGPAPLTAPVAPDEAKVEPAPPKDAEPVIARAPSGPDAPKEAQEKLVVIKPRRTEVFSVAKVHYSIIENVPTKVPESVKRILEERGAC